MQDVAEWLAGLGLGEYADAFARNKIDAGVLPGLTGEDLKDIGVVAVGDRRRLLTAIAALSPPAAAPIQAATPEKPPPEALPERRHLTVMFCDLVGSTALSARLDPEDMRDVIGSYQKAVAAEVTRLEGHVAKYMGDGVLAYFGWPEAHEDDAERATRAGLMIARAVGRLGSPGGEPLAARIGIATGLVVVGDLIGKGAAQEQAVVGDTPNLAARLQAIAAPGELLVSAATRHLLGDLFEMDDLGRQVLKGVPEPAPAFAVRRERSIESRFEARQGGRLTPMVGRDQELALLLERWRQAKAGEGQLVLLTGEAGIGKSRITRAAIDEIGRDAHVRISYQCSPYHGDSAFYPVIQQLSRAANFEADDGPTARLDKLEALLALSAGDVGEVAKLLAALLGIEAEGRYGTLLQSPQQQRTQTLQALAAQVGGLARRQPVLFVVEDAHWIDPSTLELIEIVIDRVVAEPVLILVTARPTFEPGFAGHPIVTRLALNRLGRQQVAAIANRLTGGKALPEELVEEIAAKTDGVPLFVEELTKTVLESGMLRETEDAFVIEGRLSELSIPSSLHDSLMARLDRLQPVKEVAQTAACIGREFDHRLIAALSPLSEASLCEALDRLIAAELVFRRGTPPGARYTFKHALVRDAAYESLLKGRRQQLHGRLLKVLEQESAAPELLAHHASAAGLAEKAIDYWQRAGAAAVERPAYAEAIGHYRQAIRLVREMGGSGNWLTRELELQVLLGQASIASRGYSHQQTLEIFDEALALVPAVDDEALRLAATYGRWAAHHTRAEHAEGMVLAQALVDRLPHHAADDGQRLMALRMLATSQAMSGEPSKAQENFAKALSLYDPRAHQALATRFGHEPGVGIRAYYGITLCCVGYPDRGWRLADEALAIADRLGHTNSTAYTLGHSALIACLRRDPARAAALVGRLGDLSASHSLRMWGSMAQILRGVVEAQCGDPASAADTIRLGLASFGDTHTQFIVPLFGAMLAHELAVLGRPEACQASDRNASLADSSSERLFLPEIHRLRGEVYALAGRDASEVEAAYSRALAIATGQGARSWELRAATSLARLWRSQGRLQEARDLLAPIYGWFTEGFATADLKDAKALLDDLSSTA